MTDLLPVQLLLMWQGLAGLGYAPRPAWLLQFSNSSRSKISGWDAAVAAELLEAMAKLRWVFV